MNVLVVAAHPDDEVLGSGATIAKHALAGDAVHVLILAEGVTSRDGRRERRKRSDDLSALAQAAHRANEILGVKSLTLHDFPDNRMDTVDLLDIIKVVEAAVETVRPEIVYTHHGGDLNIDHRLAHEAVVTSCRPMPGQPVTTLLCFEVPSSTEWQTQGSAPAFWPNWFVDVTSTINHKVKALDAYHSEMRPWPHARSTDAVRHLAGWRGASIGRDAAEAFMLGRKLER